MNNLDTEKVLIAVVGLVYVIIFVMLGAIK